MKVFVVYTKKKYCPKPRAIITNIDVYFSEYIKEIVGSFNEVDKVLLQEIDEAKIVDETSVLVKTPYGYCELNNISTGCKTAILANHLKGETISLNFCGMNAILSIFEHIPADRNEYYLTHKTFDWTDERYKNVLINYNKQKIVDFINLYRQIVIDG